MGVGRGVSNRAAVSSLILGRIVYAVNWYSLAAVFTFTASELNQNVSGLGLVTATFFVGIGVFQVPGGILAAKIGPRLTVIYGTAIASFAALLTGFAGNLVEIAVLRFFVGLGMAFVFAPGVILMARFLHEGSEGLGVGLYNSAFSLGGAVGLSGLAVLAAGVGWRNSLVTGGLLGLFTSVLLWFLVPKDSRRSDFTVELRHLRLVLLDKWLIVLSVAMLGLQVGSTVYSSFMAYYLESIVNVNVGEAGAIASLVSVFALASAPFAGRLFDRYGNAKKLLLVSGVLMAVGVGVAFFGTVYSAILAGVLVGLASGTGFTFGFSAARAANRLDKEYETLAVSWVNSISLFGDSVPPLLFSYLVVQYGYSPAWLYMAVLAFALIIPVLFTKVSSKKRAHAETHSPSTRTNILDKKTETSTRHGVGGGGGGGGGGKSSLFLVSSAFFTLDLEIAGVPSSTMEIPVTSIGSGYSSYCGFVCARAEPSWGTVSLTPLDTALTMIDHSVLLIVPDPSITIHS